MVCILLECFLVPHVDIWFYAFVGACKPVHVRYLTIYKYNTSAIYSHDECSPCYHAGTQVRIDCSLHIVRHYEKGPEYRTCQPNGQWDGTMQYCDKSNVMDTSMFYYCLKFF